MAFQKYTSYKESGVEWLGVIPQDWEVRRLASLGRFSKGGGISRDKLVDSGVSAILYGDIYTKYNYSTIETKNFISPETTKSAIKIIENDLLLTGSGETKEDIGKCIVFKGLEAFAGGDIIIFKQNKSNSTFLSYSLSSSYSVMQKMIMAKGEIIVHIYGSALKELLLPIPPKDEQTKIASFLDEKTTKIDEVIRQKEKLIELLKERKQIVINDAVTKGLDKNVEFLDSGVEWIGEIPKHWEIEKVKYIFKDSSIKNHGEEIPLAATQLYGVVPKDTLDYRTVEANVSDLNTFKLVKENNFVISLRSFEGGIEYSAYKGIISPAYTVMEALQDIAFKYFKYLFKSNIFIQALNIYKTGIREGQNISFAKFKDDFLPLPPKNEQMQIAKHIETQTTKIDNAIDLQQNYIAKLKEYKATLIDSVVTGKVRIS